MKESSLVRSIRDKLRSLGWKVIKIHGGPNQEAGLPDLLAIKDGRYVWLEVKVVGGKLSDVQRFRINELQGYGAEVHVVSSTPAAITATG